MRNTRLWDWYQNNNKTVQAIFEVACDLIPGGNLVKNALTLFLSRSDTNSENQELESLIEETRPTLQDIIKALYELDHNYQNLSLDELKELINRYLTAEFSESFAQLSQTINQTVGNNQPNSQIINGRYKLIKPIGRGGQGEIYLAWHLTANHQVAIKFLPKLLSNNEIAILELQQEYALLVDNLRHSHIVAYTDLDKDAQSGRYYLVMDYIEGQSLRHLLLRRNNAPLSLKESVKLLAPIAQALDYAHANRIVHCDIKPENILIRDKDQKVFLTDFGLASKIRETLTRHQNTPIQNPNLSGTLPYMAPEQYRGQAPIAQTDTWALGIVLYELLAESHPYHGQSFEHYSQIICHEEPEIIPKLSSKAWKILKRMLAKDKRKRPLVLTPLFKALIKSNFAWKIGWLILFLTAIGGSAVYFKPELVELIEDKSPVIPVVKKVETVKEIKKEPVIKLPPKPEYKPKPKPKPKPIILEKSVVQKKVDLVLQQLLNKCQQYLDRNYLTLPKKTNAFNCYQSVLKKYPNNKQALKGQQEVAQHYIILIKKTLKAGYFDKAQNHLERLRFVNAEHSELVILETALKKAREAKIANRYIILIKENIKKNQLDKAKDTLNKLQKLNAEHPEFIKLKTTLKNAKKANRYIALIEENIKITHFNKAQDYIDKLQDIQMAHADLARLKIALKKAKKIKVADHYIDLVKKNIKINDFDKARGYLNRLHGIDAEHPDLIILQVALKKAKQTKAANRYIGLIKKHIKKNNFNKAGEYINKLHDVNAKHPDLAILEADLKKAMQAKKKKEQARPHYIKISAAGEMLPNNAKDWLVYLIQKLIYIGRLRLK